MNWRRNLEGNPVTPILTGCTASGKTGILLELSEKYRIEVISADSRQVYRGMNIGTAKPVPEEQLRLPHHLIDILDPDEEFSAGMFAELATKAAAGIRERGAVPVIAGGTALYIMALCGGLDPMPPRNDILRRTLMEMERSRPGTLHKALESVDPDLACRTGPRDISRLVRALEIHLQTGKPPSDLRRGGNPSIRENYRIAAVAVPDDELKKRIRRRAEDMIRDGLVDEVRGLAEKGWGRDSAPGRTIGYSEVLDYLDGTGGSIGDVIDAVSANTWKLVRRQKNMLRRIEGINWMKDDPDPIGIYLFGEGEL